MATADISKQSVFDARIIQQSPAYAVNKGALSLTAVPFTAISATSSQHTYNCVIPSQNVFIDRAIDWSSTFDLQVPVNAITTPRGVNEAILSLGKDVALTNFPLHSLCQTMTATINDTTVTMNTSDVLKEVLRLTSFDKNKKSRTCPTKDDTYASYNDGYVSINSSLAGYSEAYDPYNVGNGAFPGIVFTDPAGNVLSGTNTYNDTWNGAPIAVSYVNGVPVRTAGTDAGNGFLYLRVSSIEKLVLSPFVFANGHEWETGLFGINAIQLVMNLSPTAVQRVLRTSSAGGRTIGTVAFRQQTFPNSQVLFQILTPSLDVPLPPKSVVPYMEFPRYLTTVNATATGLQQTATSSVPAVTSGGPMVYGGGTFDIPSQTIVLPQIPDMLIIYAKPLTYTDTTYGDYHFAPTKISINFDNFAGLLSAHTQSQLYQMSIHNGLEMDWSQWSGVGYTGQNGARISTVGGFLVLRPGQDFALQSGQAPGLAGNFVLQYNLTCQNNSPLSLASTPVALYTIAVNAGFFESMAGSSRIIKSVLSEADIISAEPSAEGSRDDLKRIVGSGFMDNLGSMLHRARKSHAEEKGKGAAGGAHTGGASVGGASMGGAKQKKMSLSARLM